MMKIKLAIFIQIFACFNLLAQSDTASIGSYSIRLDNATLEVFNEQQKPVFKKNFFNPTAEVIDLDGDGTDEYLISDLKIVNGNNYYTLYVFNAIDSFYVADSIDSGLMEPYPTFSKELNNIILVTGNSKFNDFNSDSADVFLPLNCWKYENGQMFDVNDELYDFFIAANDTMIDYIDSYLENDHKDCNNTEQLKAVLAAVYANYINAGEKILANQFLRKYYFCRDLEAFKQKISSLF